MPRARGPVDLRSPAQVRASLAGAGIDLPDTRAWRLRALAGTHPLVDALLAWRKAERVATTYGYAWLDEHLGADGRLRGSSRSGRRRSYRAKCDRDLCAQPGRALDGGDVGL